MTGVTLVPCSPKTEPPAGWGVLLALLGDWGITLRLVLLLCVLSAAIVAIVALVVIFLDAVGVAALVTSGYALCRLLARQQHCRSRRKT